MGQHEIFVVKMLRLICSIALLVGSSGIVFAEQVNDARVLNLKGTKLYVPMRWTYNAASREQGQPVDRSNSSPNNPIGSAAGEGVPVTELIWSFCNPRPAKTPPGTSSLQKIWHLERNGNADWLPRDWCVGRVYLQSGPHGLASQPRLGPRGIAKDFEISQRLSSIDDLGFRTRSLDPKTKSGTYYGYLDTDIAPGGGPISIYCGADLANSGFFKCDVTGFAGGGEMAIDGVRAYAFEWHVSEIKPADLRKMFWRSHRILDWLATPPDKRSETINDVER